MSLEEYTKKRFLIVDELDSFRFSTKNTLMSLGLKLVDTASTAQKVIAGFKNVNYDVILCNYELGKGKNGQELLEELRYKKLLKFTGLFFIITAEVERGKVMGTIENEPDGYLVKPVKPNELEQRLTKALQMKEAMRDIDTAIDEGDYHSAIAYCDRKIAAKDRYIVRCMKTKAWLLTKLGDLDEAKQVYESVLSADDFVWAQYGLAKILVKKKAYEEAKTLLNKIIDKYPDQIEAMDLLAEILKKQNKPAEALEVVEKAISKSPNSLLRQKQLADLCIENKKTDGALDAFRKVVKLGDQSVYAQPEQYFDFANFLAETAKDSDDPDNHSNVKEAFELLNKSKKRFANVDHIEDQSMIVSANVNAVIGNEEAAKEILDSVMKVNPDAEEQLDAKSLRLAAQTYTTLGDEDEAEKLLEYAADLAASDADLVSDIYDQMNEGIGSEARQQAAMINKKGIKLYSDGDIEGAAQELKKALPLTPRHISLNLNLVQVLLKLHKKQKDDALLREIKSYLHKVRHIPKHHKEYRRYAYLLNQFESRQG